MRYWHMWAFVVVVNVLLLAADLVEHDWWDIGDRIGIMAPAYLLSQIYRREEEA